MFLEILFIVVSEFFIIFFSVFVLGMFYFSFVFREDKSSSEELIFATFLEFVLG